MGANGLAVAGRGAWVVWLRTILGAVAATLVVRAAALAVFDIPTEFEPHPQKHDVFVLDFVNDTDTIQAAGQCRTASVGEGTVERDRCGLAPIHATTPRRSASRVDLDAEGRQQQTGLLEPVS